MLGSLTSPAAGVPSEERRAMALQFVSREEWGAKPPRKVTKLDPSNLSGVALHWFGSPSAAPSHEGCAALLRSVQATHMAPGGLGDQGRRQRHRLQPRRLPARDRAHAPRLRRPDRRERQHAREQRVRRRGLHGRREGRPPGHRGGPAGDRRGDPAVAGEGRRAAREAARLLHRLEVPGPRPAQVARPEPRIRGCSRARSCRSSQSRTRARTG